MRPPPWPAAVPLSTVATVRSERHRRADQDAPAGPSKHPTHRESPPRPSVRPGRPPRPESTPSLGPNPPASAPRRSRSCPMEHPRSSSRSSRRRGPPREFAPALHRSANRTPPLLRSIARESPGPTTEAVQGTPPFLHSSITQSHDTFCPSSWGPRPPLLADSWLRQPETTWGNRPRTIFSKPRPRRHPGAVSMWWHRRFA